MLTEIYSFACFFSDQKAKRSRDRGDSIGYKVYQNETITDAIASRIASSRWTSETKFRFEEARELQKSEGERV